jgi:hypothetical protein
VIFSSMGMAKSIGIMASFPNVSSNENILVIECVMEL